MRTSALLAAPVLALTALTLTGGPAAAQGEHASYQATLNSQNNSGTTGQALIQLHGNEATVTLNVAGAAPTLMGAPYAHGQHIHIGGQGACAGPAADADADGVVNSMEGQPIEGFISTSLTVSGDASAASAAALDRFPAGSSYQYSRTLTLDAATVSALQAGNAVMEVHGVDPALVPAAAQAKVNPMVPSLPLATDLPAACGQLVAAQVGSVPNGAADTGAEIAGSLSPENSAVSVAALGALMLAGGALAGRAAVLRRREQADS
ncbi:hypothetical protein E2F48_07045 [Arthrobacter crusticola]|uniref:CHRD domain-containing protein n=1 Tax=Arthrobacter crusticola TaxID=2547960 RepID=A0A4R5U051_9MICC|nr:hypothetical protein [Arthrobacter crusticola]TDK26908.1 hypothetical protein E2F48_07045 [Arthrobacter crusticola]